MDVLLFHHALGVTSGVREFARKLESTGHRVAVPDLYDGRAFDSLDEGMEHAHNIGLDRILARGAAEAHAMPASIAVIGMSLGALAAQYLAQRREGVRGAILLHGGVPIAEFGGWASGVQVQAHVSTGDPFRDQPVLQAITKHAGGEYFEYPGHGHLFTDASTADHDAKHTRLVIRRCIHFLDALHD